jgi:hypothetical protein
VRVPSFSEPAKKTLIVFGPVLFVLCVGIHVPLISRAVNKDSRPEVIGIETVRFERPGGGIGRAFFTPNGYLIAMTEMLRNNAEVILGLGLCGHRRTFRL